MKPEAKFDLSMALDFHHTLQQTESIVGCPSLSADYTSRSIMSLSHKVCMFLAVTGLSKEAGLIHRHRPVFALIFLVSENNHRAGLIHRHRPVFAFLSKIQMCASPA